MAVKGVCFFVVVVVVFFLFSFFFFLYILFHFKKYLSYVNSEGPDQTPHVWNCTVCLCPVLHMFMAC